MARRLVDDDGGEDSRGARVAVAGENNGARGASRAASGPPSEFERLERRTG